MEWLQGFALLSVQIHVLFGGYPWTDRVAVHFGVREWIPGTIQGCQSILGFRKGIYSEQTMAPLDMCDKGGRGKYSTCICIYTYRNAL